MEKPFDTGDGNHATLFLLPTLGLKEEDLLRNRFHNCYISDINKDIEGNNLLYCLFRPVKDFTFEKFVSDLENENSVICDYDYEDGWCVLVVEVPEEYSDDYQKILDSQYSETSEAFKALHSPTITVLREGVKMLVANKIYSALTRGEIMREVVEKYFDVDIDEMGPEFQYWPKFDEGKISNELNIEDIYERYGGRPSEADAAATK